jgi:hypothetical protein
MLGLPHTAVSLRSPVTQRIWESLEKREEISWSLNPLTCYHRFNPKSQLPCSHQGSDWVWLGAIRRYGQINFKTMLWPDHFPGSNVPGSLLLSGHCSNSNWHWGPHKKYEFRFVPITLSWNVQTLNSSQVNSFLIHLEHFPLPWLGSQQCPLPFGGSAWTSFPFQMFRGQWTSLLI